MLYATSALRRSLRRPLQQVATYYVKPKKNEKASTQAWFALAGVTTAIAGAAVYLLGKPDEAIGGLDTPDPYQNENIIKAYLLRAKDRLSEYKKSVVEPSSKQLLPDVLPHPYQRPYTLILEVNDVLMHREYERTYGWKYQKRPGTDALLVKLFDLYEIVTFTSENALTGHPIITSLDPNNLSMYHLYRDSTKYVDGHHVKDLSNVNRPLNRVIVIDTDPKSVCQPHNSIILDKWTGDIHDRTLFDLIPFLQAIAMNDVDDVRPVLDYYKSQGKNVVEVFKENQAKLMEKERQRLEEQKQLAEQLPQKGKYSITPFSLGSVARRKQAPSVTMEQSEPDHIQNQPGGTAEKSNDQTSWSATSWIGAWLGWR